MIEVLGEPPAEGNHEDTEKDKPEWRVVEDHEIPREMINEGCLVFFFFFFFFFCLPFSLPSQLAFYIEQTQEILRFDISRTLKTKAGDVLGLEIYVDPETGKKGYRWKRKEEERAAPLPPPIAITKVKYILDIYIYLLTLYHV